MNNLINIQKHPYIVLEGHVDSDMALKSNRIYDKYEKKVVMYAGLLRRIYGIDMLVRAFIKANIENAELHIYGNGDFAEELKNLCLVHKNIIFHGVRLNQQIVDAEIRSTLLVNPRPTSQEYTKYSFPSKNLEYMVSGTPLLTTRLPGMPKEYEDYVYLIKDESIEGIRDSLMEVLSLSPEELHAKGMRAKQFVLQNKSNILQASRIIDMIKKHET